MFYNDIAKSYDEIVCWDGRLKKECSQLQTIFKRYRVKTILDIGCGTGMHVIDLSKRKYKITGIDNSPGMLAEARINASECKAKSANFLRGEFTRLTRVVKGPLDAVICMGNSLPHLVDDEDIKITLGNIIKLLKPGGLFALQLVNFDHYLDSPQSAVAVTEGVYEGQPVTFRRHYEFKGTKVIFHICLYDKPSRDLLKLFSTPINPIRKELLEKFMVNAGFVDTQFYEDFNMQPISEETRSLACISFKPNE